MLTTNVSCDFIAGWIAGMGGLICGHPADTIKVRQQTLGAGVIRTIITTYNYEGMRGFFKGMSFPLLSAGVMNSIFFGVYGMTYRLLEKRRERTNDDTSKRHYFWDVYLAGCAAGFVQCFIASPIELVKTQLQINTEAASGAWAAHYESHCRGPIECLRMILRQNGILGLYRGFVPMLYRDVIASGTYMLTYAACIDYTSPLLGCATVLVSGGLAGAISWAAIIPFDVVKSRVQADNPKDPTYKGLWDCAMKSYRAEGLPVFMKGFWVIVTRGFLVNGAVFLGYESMMKACSTFLRKQQQGS